MPNAWGLLQPITQGPGMEQDAVTRATYNVDPDDLERMLLSKEQLPPGSEGFQVVREGELSNEDMADLPLAGHSAAELRRLGRVTGFQREWLTTAPEDNLSEGADLALATVVHFMESPSAVSNWMERVFLGEFKEKVGQDIGQGHQLLSVEEISLDTDFHHEAVGIRAVQEGPKGLVSSSVLDFRVGRLLGVVYVVTVGDRDRLSVAENLGKTLERHMISVVLGAA